MSLRNYFLPALSAVLVVASASAQEPPAVPSTAGETTMPAEIVRPQESNDNFVDNPNFYSYGTGGSIPWSAGAQSFGQRVGSYNQPVWTTQRPFSTTRAYVLPSGTYEFEQWARPTWENDGSHEWRMLEEVSLGLGCRVQLDLYERWNIEPDDNGNEQANHEGVQIEMRYALADWGVIPLNPTLYAEWIERGGPQEDKPNKFETKLLLSDELTPCIFFASNVILEQEVAGELETEIGWNNAVGTPIVDGVLMGSIESEFSATTTKDNRSDAEILMAIGPGLQLRPTPRTFLDIVGLFGTTDESYVARMYIVWGFQFGTRAGPSGSYASSEGYRGSAATRSD